MTTHFLASPPFTEINGSSHHPPRTMRLEPNCGQSFPAPGALARTVVALLAVLPEYAVDFIFAVKAGQDPTFAPYAAANMTGSNRLLVGLGWSTVSFIAWFARRETVLHLEREAILPLLFL